jgi:hypothetical protein
MRALRLALAGVAALAVAGCSGDGETSQDRESTSRQQSYDTLVAGQPAHRMSYSSTRETINFWIDKWGQPNKLSYVYLMNSNGDMLGYYILRGLPVSYCAALTPNYELIDAPHDGDSIPDFQVPAPGVDGAYYSGGQCNTFYGRDATTDAYLEYTAGLGINVLLYDAPLPRQDAQPLGPTSIEDVE